MWDNEVREMVSAELRSGAISEATNSQDAFDEIERMFPVGLNRIAWEQVANRMRIEVFAAGAGGQTSEQVERRLESCRSEVLGWLHSNGISMLSEVIWVGDSTDFALKMRLDVAARVFPKLFSLPQHSYILSADYGWCLNYVMEGELFWGWAQHAKASTRRPLGGRLRK